MAGTRRVLVRFPPDRDDLDDAERTAATDAMRAGLLAYQDGDEGDDQHD